MIIDHFSMILGQFWALRPPLGLFWEAWGFVWALKMVQGRPRRGSGGGFLDVFGVSEGLSGLSGPLLGGLGLFLGTPVVQGGASGRVWGRILGSLRVPRDSLGLFWNHFESMLKQFRDHIFVSFIVAKQRFSGHWHVTGT